MNQIPETATGALAQMPSTATEVAKFSKLLIQAVKSGDVNPLQLIVQLHALTKVYEEVREEIEANVLREAEKFPERIIERYGARIEKAEVGVSYNYLKCGDPTFERLEVDFETAKRKLDERKEFLRSLKEPLTELNEQTGELSKITPPVKRSKAGFKIFLANLK
jgi:hypothetical protein